MQKLFIARFFVTQRDVTLADLSNMKQKPNETVDAFIQRWRSEANKCRAHLSEEEQVQLCRNGIKDEISLLVSEQITSFRVLANEAFKKERILMQRDEKAKQKDNAPRPQKKEKGGSQCSGSEEWGLKEAHALEETGSVPDDDEEWELLCPKNIPDVLTPPPKRHWRSRGKELRKEREE